MKYLVAILLSITSFSAYSLVDSSQCPEQFLISFNDLNRVELNSEIESSWSLKAGWNAIENASNSNQVFNLITRSSTALYVYTNGVVAALGATAKLFSDNARSVIAINDSKNVSY